MPPVNLLSERTKASNTGGMMIGVMHKDWGKQFGPALLIAVLALFSLYGTASAQGLRDLPPPPPAPTPKPTPTPAPVQPKDEDFDVIRVSSSLVMVPVSVVDAQGQPVHGLQLNDFRLDEEGRAQQITEIGNPDQVPLDIAILFDVSSSVSQKGFFEFQQKAAASFLKQVMKPVDRAAIFTIQDRPKLVAPLANSDKAAFQVLAVPPATTPVPTAFYDTVIAAATYLTANSSEGHRRVILVISDGDDNFSNVIRDLSIAEARANQKGELSPAAARESLRERRRRAVLDVQRAVQQADAAFYSVNPGGPSVRLNEISMRAQNNMQSIAASTGGTAYLPGSERDLENVFSEVAAELRGQYLIQYYSNSQAAGTQFRRIAVTLPTRADLRVRARQGYYPKNK
jgi:Ca-activated chloride channel family protein